MSLDFSKYKNRLPFPERKSSISSMEWGHSAGYSDVFSYLEELAGLLKS